MRRREFITLFGGAAATLPFGAYAQPVGAIPTVGVLMAGVESAPDNQKCIGAFRQGLAERGWKDGDNVRFDVRWSAGKGELIQRSLGIEVPPKLLFTADEVIE